MSDNEAEFAYRMMLVATGAECDHPAQWRDAPPYPTSDSKEWVCRICGIAQVRDPSRDAANRLGEALG